MTICVSLESPHALSQVILHCCILIEWAGMELPNYQSKSWIAQLLKVLHQWTDIVELIKLGNKLKHILSLGPASMDSDMLHIGCPATQCIGQPTGCVMQCRLHQEGPGQQSNSRL